MIASVLHLNRTDVKNLKITDAYSLHRVVYDLFDDVRSADEKQTSVTSGILYADKGGDIRGRKILLLSNRQPNTPEHGELSTKKIADSFLDYQHYRFEIIINPVKCGTIRRDAAGKKRKGEIIPLKTREDIAEWFIQKSPDWGFSTSPEHLEVRDIQVKRFKKGVHNVTQAQASLFGRLTVTDKEKFIHSFQNGIGRGRAFGCGLLQIVPL